MTDYQSLLLIQRKKLTKALVHLEYSYQKVLLLPNDISQLNEETLETWESFAARFCRVSDIFLSKYIRTQILINDPGFTGSLRDFLNQAEKFHLIDNTDKWMEIQELRNISAHDYSEIDLSIFFEQLRATCPILLAIREKL